jgi:hypothetical protein
LSRAPAPAGLLRAAALLAGPAAAAAVAAGISGRAREAVCGAAAGLLIGLLGHLFARRALSPAAPVMADSLRLWSIGMAVRLASIAALAVAFWAFCPDSYEVPMLTMAAAWLATHSWSIVRLCRLPAAVPVRNKVPHG